MGSKNHQKLITPLLLVVMAVGMSTAALFGVATAQEKKGRGDDTLRLHSDLVLVNVTVTGPGGAYVHGLTSKDFALIEDTAPQSIDSFAAEDAPFAAAILIDMSGSMESKFGLARGAAASFLENIRENDQVAVYGFNRKTRLLQEFSNSRDVTDYIWDAKAEYETQLYDCMDTALDALAQRLERRRAILLISDGWDTLSGKASMGSVTKKALAMGVTIYTIDLVDNNLLVGSASHVAGLQRGRRELQEFARQSGGSYVHTPHGDKLEEAFTNIVEELRNQYTLGYYSTNPKRDGRWRSLTVNISRSGLTPRARRGYYAPKD